MNNETILIYYVVLVCLSCFGAIGWVQRWHLLICYVQTALQQMSRFPENLWGHTAHTAELKTAIKWLCLTILKEMNMKKWTVQHGTLLSLSTDSGRSQHKTDIYSSQDQKYTRNSYTSSAKWVYILIDWALLVQCKFTKPWNSNSSKEPFQQY